MTIKKLAHITMILTIGFGISIGGFSGCSADPDASASLEIIPSTEVEAGKYIVLDATQSEFDSIRWTLNGEELTQCDGQYICGQKMELPGTYVYTLIVEVSGSGSNMGAASPRLRDSISAVITVRAAAE